MSTEAGDRIGDALGALADAAERAGAYADVWRSAIERNADGEYAGEHLLADAQQLWRMGVDDAATLVAAWLRPWTPDRDPTA